ncbi:MAG: insulinase family protein [Prevotella sp.]|nr:insulinase family protein [Prevotella sp.]MDY4039936.1 pitrilysin family protein [Prevotella sp.]
MRYNTHQLSNGLRIIHLPAEGHVVYCGYEINAGTRDELPGEEGLAHFCEHLSFKGTAHRRAWHIINRLESVGGDLNAFTTKEDTVYYAAILREHTARAADLLTDIVFHSTYPQNEIDKEVEVICDEIESYNDSPAELIYDEFENTIFAGHPLGHNILGEAARVRSFTTADALRFTRRYYRPDNAVFFAYGDIDFQRMVRMLEQATSDLSKGQGPAPRTTALPPYQAQELVRKRGTHQAHVMIGNRAYDIHHPLRVALYLINNMLGGPGMNARLNVSLREHNGLVYTAESSMVSYGDTGLWCAYFGCDPHDVNRCRRLVKKELDRLIENPVSEAKLKAAKKQLKGQIGVACDNRESFALDFGKSFLHYGWEKDITSLYRHIDAVTAADIRRVAADLFPSNRLTTLLYL